MKALNDILVLEEEPVDFEVDNPSGLSKAVVEALKSSKLVIPEEAEFYAKKYPCIGKVLFSGSKCKYGIAIGARVLFARFGVMREQVDGKNLVFVREQDIHAVLD